MRRFLLIGATGSFGEAFLRSLEREAAVVGVGRDVVRLDRLRALHPHFHPIVADVREPESLRALRRFYPFDALIHAAALKVVGLGEESPLSYLYTNAIGTYLVQEILGDIPARLFLSTDKAVEPVNAYGLSKAWAERIWRGQVIRLGNVLDARGGVLSKWLRGGEIRLCLPAPTRFVFYTDQVASLALRALMEPPGVYIPRDLAAVDLGEVAAALHRPITRYPLPPFEKQHEVLASAREAREEVGPFLRLTPSHEPHPPLRSDLARRLSPEEVIREVSRRCRDRDELPAR